MPATYEPIASQTLGSAASSVEFTSISGTYTDLVLIVAAINSSTPITMRFQVNGDTGGNYSTTVLYGSGSAGSERSSNAAFGRIAYFSERTVSKVHFMSYANTNVNKTVLSSGGNTNDVTSIVSLWRSTAAINSIYVYSDGVGNVFGAGSTFSLYGIKAA